MSDPQSKSQPTVLLSREQSSMVSTWEEYLCIERVRDETWQIGVYQSDVIGNVYDVVPEEQRYTDDGELFVPEEVNGRRVYGLSDGEWLLSGELVCIDDFLTFESKDVGAVRQFAVDQHWDRCERFEAAMSEAMALLRAE